MHAISTFDAPSLRAALPEDAWRSLLQACPRSRVGAETTLLSRGATDRAMVILAAGDAEVVVGQADDELVVGNLGPGDHAGGLGLLGLSARRTASVRAASACVLHRLEPLGLAELERRGHPAPAIIEREALRSLVAHFRVVCRELDRLDPEFCRPMPAPLAGARPPGAGQAIDLDLLLGNLPVDQLRANWPPGQPLTGLDRADPWVVLHGRVRRFRVHANGRRTELRAAYQGEVGGFEAALGASDLAGVAQVDPGTVLAWLPATACTHAMVATDPLSRALRRAMAETLAQRIDHGVHQLRASSAASGQPLRRDEIDQLRMLSVGSKGAAGAL